MKLATVLLAGALLVSPAAHAQTASNSGGGKPARSDAVKVPRASTLAATHASDTDRLIDDEMKRIDRMMTICTGC